MPDLFGYPVETSRLAARRQLVGLKAPAFRITLEHSRLLRDTRTPIPTATRGNVTSLLRTNPVPAGEPSVEGEVGAVSKTGNKLSLSTDY